MAVKRLYVDSNLLEKRISDSPISIKEIVEALGISRQAFDKKRKGYIAFRASEVYVVCDLLHIGIDDRMKIFYPIG